MITFKNIAGNKFLAVGTIQRKSALNGEKSLTGTLYDGKDVLNKIDKGWSLEFDGEPYVVTYFERNDNDNSVSFDAIHKFFWDMTKKVLYSSTEISGSHTIKWYLDQIFANTGYTYALNFSPAAIEKDNWGNKTRLSLFNDLITSIAGEFEINGTLISIFQNIGTDLSTIVRYGFNLSDMTIENDATSFVTYGEGFGAYADQQNQTGDRVHATYTSPLASVYGILQAEPIDDQRYTSQSNLQAAVKAQVDASFSVSVQLSLYDLTAAGYPYKMANVGDWLTAVDENLDFKQRIRIISIDDEFSADGTRISYTVTAGDIGLNKKYQDANASLASQVANAIVSANQASVDANIAIISANGKNTSYRLDSVDDLPKTANEGDLAWVKSGDGTIMYIYTKKADGSYYWEKRIDPEMGDQIAAGVTEAVTQANAHTDSVKQGLSTDISTAKSQAASQASAAEANAKNAATSQFNQAQSALSAAQKDLTNSIASEAAERVAAVSAANSQAQSYANQAKADAMSAASSADGVIRTAISSSADSLSATITQNKSSADSGISTAQTTAKAAVDGLKLKVSQTDYDQVTGDLSTKINDVKETADGSKQDIADIKIADGQQDAKITEIETTASGLKSTVSDLSTAQGRQSGDISTLQQRADGFDATVTKVDNLAVGGRNLLFGTVNGFTGIGTNSLNGDFNAQGGQYYLAGGKKVSDIYNQYGPSGYLTLSFEWVASGSAVSGEFRPQWNGDPWAGLADNGSIKPSTTNSSGYYKITFPLNTHGLDTGNATAVMFRQDNLQGNIIISNLKLEAGNIATDWSPAPEDLSGATAKAQLTADQATTAINTYKTSNDGRVASAESKITQNANDITTRVTQTDYNQKTGELSGNISALKQRADGFDATVTKVDNLAVGGRNLYLKSRELTDGYGTNGSVTVMVEPFDSTTNMWHLVAAQGTVNVIGIYLFEYGSGKIPNNSDWSYSADIKGTGQVTNFGIEDSITSPVTGTIGSDWSRISQTGHVNEPQYKTIVMYFDITDSPLDVYIKLPKLETGNIAADWTPAPEDVESALSQVKITADGINNFVRDSSGNISSDFQTALSKTSIVTGSTLATSIQKQTATQITSALTDNNGKIISLINQDTSGVQISGNKIILDGSVVVTQDFYARGAYFKNLNAAAIVTGTLSSNVFAANTIDVNALTGNTSNFVKSNWDSVYGGNVSITGAGMTVSYGNSAMVYNNAGMNVTLNGNNTGIIGPSLSNGYSGLSFFIDDERQHYMSWVQRSGSSGGFTPMMVWSGFDVAQKTNGNPNGGFRIWDNIDFDTYDNTTSETRWNANSKVRFWTSDIQFGAKFSEGNRYFKLAGRTITLKDGSKRYAYGFSDGNDNGGVFFDGYELWLKNANGTYSLTDIINKINS